MAAVDNFSPREIARLVETKGVAKAEAPLLATLVLGVVAGAFIALGAVLSTVVSTGSALGEGPTRLLAGLAFSLGLILVVVAGAELFTGNNLVVMSWVSGKVTLAKLLRNWGVVYVGNALGALSVASLAYMANWWSVAANAVGANALAIAATKASLPFGVTFMRGILANALVCLAVWLATAGRSLTDKVLAIVFPISAFVAAGFEHSIANMYFIPMGLLLANQPAVVDTAALSAERLAGLDVGGLITNISAATLGNVVGGAGLVGLVYWFVYLRGGPSGRQSSR
ncbi:MAG TPA: formate/nitrite transporter family protein [Acidimicrobiia bacterium]|jgi:formate/nitrite transporter